MNVRNAWFLPAEISLFGFTISHTMVNDTLQTLLLILTIVATAVGIWRTLKGKK